MNRNDVTKKASSYVGHYSNPNIFTLWFFKNKQKHAWCGAFVDYVFKHDLKCDWLDSCSNFGYVPTIVSWAKKKGYWATDYKLAREGDLVVYNWKPKVKNNYSHVGIVKEFKGSTMTSIEGNTTNGSLSNCVAIKKRNKKYIAGIVRLPYKTPTIPSPILRKGNKGVRVKNLQTCLVYLGYKLTIDGIFGNDTFKKLKQFQKDNKLVKDGIYGEKSYKKMKELIK